MVENLDQVMVIEMQRPNNPQPNGTGPETGLGGPGGVGSGGGGGGMGVSVQQGGHGGPGICIVRYATPGFEGGHTAIDRLVAFWWYCLY